ALLALAGIVAGNQQFEFPRMSSPVTGDSPPQTLVPMELFKPSCDPTNVLTAPGFQVNVHGLVNGPNAEGAVFTHRWDLGRPYGSEAALSDSTAEVASFVPDIRGTYRLDMRIQVEVPGASTTFLEAAPLFITAADDATETFEENVLTSTRPFAWRNDENVPWAIETGMALTGSRAVASGPVGHGQLTDLAIRVFLPQADSLHFAVRTSTETNWDYLDFLLDDIVAARWSGETAWTTATVGIPAGEHNFTWRYSKDGSVSYGLDRAWVDDIFFPVDAVTTPIESTDEPAWTFALDPPYPNPARETSTLGYTLTSDAEVSLDLFDVLGRKVVTVAHGRRTRGRHEETVSTTGLPAGLFVAVLRAGDRVQTRALLITR
ncbi:MAG TPA: T9SS type A sorting domain-containing protein, partial [Rhodothermia bacterium]